MIRQPSSEGQLLAWHRAALAGHEPERHEGDPQCGWFKMRLTKGGHWVPVTVWCDQDVDEETGELTSDEVMRADVFGDDKPADEIWTHLTPISREEHDHLWDHLLRNQHRINSMAPVDVGAAPTLPEG